MMAQKVGVETDKKEKKVELPKYKPAPDRFSKVAMAVAASLLISCGGGPGTGGQTAGGDGGVSQDSGDPPDAAAPYACTDPVTSPNVYTFKLNEQKAIVVNSTDTVTVQFNGLLLNAEYNALAADLLTGQVGSPTTNDVGLRMGQISTSLGFSLQACEMTSQQCYSSGTGDQSCKVTLYSSKGWK